MNLFEKIEVWKPRVVREEFLIYVCFKNLITNKYYVQNAHSVTEINKTIVSNQIMQNLQEFLFTNHTLINEYYDTLEEAIDKFEEKDK